MNAQDNNKFVIIQDSPASQLHTVILLEVQDATSLVGLLPFL